MAEQPHHFRPGDRVIYTGKKPGWKCSNRHIGQAGTVAAAANQRSAPTDIVRVHWDAKGPECPSCGVYSDNIDLIHRKFAPGTRVRFIGNPDCLCYDGAHTDLEFGGVYEIAQVLSTLHSPHPVGAPGLPLLRCRRRAVTIGRSRNGCCWIVCDGDIEVVDANVRAVDDDGLTESKWLRRIRLCPTNS